MKIISKLTIITCVLLCNILVAQNDSLQLTTKKKSDYNKGLNSNTFGGIYAIPLGAFGSTSSENAGFAKNGYGFAFDSKSYVGLGISFVSHSTYSWIDLDSESMSKQLTESFGSKVEINNGQHQPFLSTIGVNYDHFFSKAFNIGLNAQAGVLYNSFRAMELKIYDNANNLFYSDILSFQSNFAFAYTFGADITLALIPEVLALRVSADYTAGKLDTYLVSTKNDPIKSIEKMQFLNLGAGLVFYKKK